MPQAAAEPPVLLGADPFKPELHAPAQTAQPARRPGWGTMDPIPNPGEFAAVDRKNPPYRLIGPTIVEPQRAQRETPAVRVATRIRAAEPVAKVRVRHVIMPGARPAASAGPNEG
jgi:hypothetical protein